MSGWGADPLLPPPPKHTLESKETKNSTLEYKGNDQMLKNLDVRYVNKRKNRLTPAKLESKIQDKKALASWEGLGVEFPSNVEKKPHPI